MLLPPMKSKFFDAYPSPTGICLVFLLALTALERASASIDPAPRATPAHHHHPSAATDETKETKTDTDHVPSATTQATTTLSTSTTKAPTEDLAASPVETTTLKPTTTDKDLTPKTTTTTTTTTTTATTQEPQTSTTEKPRECQATFCLNGGVCKVLEDGSEKCFCPEAFWGARCQLRNICRSLIADGLMGEQICKRIGRACIIDDKLFRCQCGPDEFFLFKADYYKSDSSSGSRGADAKTGRQHGKASDSPQPVPTQTTFAYDNVLALVTRETTTAANDRQHQHQEQLQPQTGSVKKPNYLAECRRVNKCLGVRCRQLSEVCHEGQCTCNQNLGYILDPIDGLCKLLDPCKMHSKDGLPICGEAKCLPTFDQELFRCVCPIGYHAIQRGPERSSTQCAILSTFICMVPLLNKCQHLCHLDNASRSYKCSCLPGYKPGTRAGHDDHLCFFDEHLAGSSSGGGDDQRNEYDEHRRRRFRRSWIQFAPIDENDGTDGSHKARASTHPGRIVRRTVGELGGAGAANEKPIQVQRHSNDLAMEPDDTATSYDYDPLETSQEDSPLIDLSQLSAQERCNMYCDENKICVLADEATGSYRCLCDRQGYVSVGDKCLDWCAATEFRYEIRVLLDLVCVTGLCRRRPSSIRPPLNLSASFYSSSQFKQAASEEEERELARLEARSSWRPTFECDCSTSPLIYADPHTHLCKVNFEAILKPCMPGEEGHTDCVVNKHAYCAVLHQDPLLHHRGLTTNQLMDQLLSCSGKATNATNATNAADQDRNSPPDGQRPPAPSGKKALKPKEKSYVCVCSPDKKLLVDKPRNKARCVDECDLLNNECGRFNRMCRAATISSDGVLGDNATLLRQDQDGVRLNQFKRTGCECLPGFNVGPSEPRDFTLDTNYPSTDDSGAGSDVGSNQQAQDQDATDPTTRPRKFSWDALQDIFQDPTLVVVNDPGAVLGKLIQDDFTGQEIEHLRRRYMNINSRCLLDYDVVEFHARFRAPSDFEPAWVASVLNGDDRDANEHSPPAGSPAAGPLPAEGSSRQKWPSQPPPRAEDAVHEGRPGREAESSPQGRGSQAKQQDWPMKVVLSGKEDNLLKVPDFMRANVAEFYKHIVLVADCDFLMSQKSFEAYEQCIRYRYWPVQKLRAHFADWREVMSRSLRESFDLMDGNIRVRVNKCEAKIRRVTSLSGAYAESLQTVPPISYPASNHHHQQQQQQHKQDQKPVASSPSEFSSASSTRSHQAHRPQASRAEQEEVEVAKFDPWDQYARVDADIDCKLTIHSASDYDSSGARRNAKKVLLEKQLPKFIFKDLAMLSELAGQGCDNSSNSSSSMELNNKRQDSSDPSQQDHKVARYYLMAPNVLIHHESYDQLADHRKVFSPCNSEYSYCDKQTRCEMQDTVNYSCTCEAGYTPIGSRDIYFGDSNKEVCEDINECLFDVCKGNGLEDKSICVNEIGDYRCQCIRHYVGDNKRFCDYICNVIACKHGDCRIPDEHHAFCECHQGYREADCSVQDPSVALRKANMIICGSIFASVLLLVITLAISLNSQLKKTKKELKRLEAAQEAVEFYEFSLQQPPYRHRVSKASIGS